MVAGIWLLLSGHRFTGPQLPSGRNSFEGHAGVRPRVLVCGWPAGQEDERRRLQNMSHFHIDYGACEG
jgi:hypothetical protein